jgi:hypothetical protein
MAGRINHTFLRTLRALQDQRRSPPLLVRNARQVNVGRQQINLGGD